MLTLFISVATECLFTYHHHSTNYYFTSYCGIDQTFLCLQLEAVTH
jgi:hypothetical protein